MILVFQLLIFIGDVQQREEIYFYDINRCKYFAERIMSQPSYPKGEAKVNTTAYCKAKKVNYTRALKNLYE